MYEGDGEFVATGYFRYYNGSTHVIDPITIRFFVDNDDMVNYRVLINGHEGYTYWSPDDYGWRNLYNAPNQTGIATASNGLDIRTVFPSIGATAFYDIDFTTGGSPLVTMMNNLSLMGGGEGGVDGDDWEYWFNVAGPGEPGNGKLFDLYEGLTYWFGSEDPEDQGEMYVLGYGMYETLLDMMALLSIDPGDIDPEEPPLMSYAFTLDDLTLIDPEEDLQFTTKRDDLIEAFQDLSIPEGITDNTENEDIEFNIPFNEWFGGMMSQFGHTTGNMGSLNVHIDTSKFDEIRTPLHALVYMLLSVWSGLMVFREFKKR